MEQSLSKIKFFELKGVFIFNLIENMLMKNLFLFKEYNLKFTSEFIKELIPKFFYKNKLFNQKKEK